MTDIVELLRMAEKNHNVLCGEAADEIERLRAAIREAVAAEREACAKVAEEYDNGRRVPDFNGEISESVSGRKIAAAIRSRKEGEG